jgi:hypothetical protein
MVEHGSSRKEVLEYAYKFEATVAPLCPRLIHLYQDDPADFMRTYVLPKRGPEWAAKVSSHLTSTPCCQQHGWDGVEGMLRFWVHYQEICRDLCSRIGIPTLLIENSSQAWSEIHEQIGNWLSPPRPGAVVVLPAV